MSKRNEIIDHYIVEVKGGIEWHSDKTIERIEPPERWTKSKAKARYRRKILREIKLKLQEMKT